MLAITLADLRMRFRQFLIAVVGAGLVFAIALLLTGMVNGFDSEIDRTVGSAEADGWVIPTGTSGPFTSVRGIPQATVRRVAADKGVEDASGMVISVQTVLTDESGHERIMMIGAGVGRPGQATPDEGSAVRRHNEAVVDRRLGLGIGERFVLAGREFSVVGLVEGMTMLGGTPDVWITLRAAQRALFRGQQLVTTVVVTGQPTALPDGLILMSGDDVEKDSLGPMNDAVVSIDNTRYLMWATAAVIVAALIYVSALQRTRDFAVLKAVGASSRSLFLGVAIQAVLVTVAAALFAIASSRFMLPLYTVPIEVPVSAYLMLPLVAVVVGVLSSLVALRPAVKADPALAFGGG